MSAMTSVEATTHITTTDERFLLGEAMVRGESLPVFANAPTTIPALQAFGQSIRAPGANYLVHEGERLSYDDWCRETEKLSAGLAALGVHKGDRVAVAMRNYPEYLTLMMAIAALGGVAVLINAWWTTDELEYGFTDCGAKLVFADGPRAERILPFAEKLGLKMIYVRDDAPSGALTWKDALGDEPAPVVDITPDDDFLIMYSSGSTGQPKGVVLTHRGATQATWSWFMALEMAPLLLDSPPPKKQQCILCVTPLFHVTATHPSFLLSIALGAKFVMMRKWDAERAVDLVDQEKVTRFLGVPTMCAELADAAKRLGRTLPSLGNLSAGGAKRPGAQVAQQAAVLPNAAIATGYGLTETNALGLGISGENYVKRPEAAGRPYAPIQQFRIIDDNGQEVPQGAIGELCMKSATLMRGYLNNPEATAEAIREGWFHTGDLATVDEEGFYTIVDRKKTIIIRGGENISCLEVEGALHRHPNVLEAAVFPLPDERLGEVVGASVSVTGDVTPEALADFLDGLLASFKHPVRYWIQEAPLIRGATDKIDRRAIRQACLASLEAA